MKTDGLDWQTLTRQAGVSTYGNGTYSNENRGRARRRYTNSLATVLEALVIAEALRKRYFPRQVGLTSAEFNP